MALKKLALSPGVNTEATPTQAQGTWVESNLIRFRDGFLEKMFGWVKYCQTAVTGVARSLWTFLDAAALIWTAVGTNLRLQVINNGVLYDITPLRTTTNPAVNFSTVINTKTVTIVDVAFGGSTGDEVFIQVPVAIGGLVLQGYYTITKVNANTYTIQSPINAAAIVNNAGAVPLFNTTNTSTDVLVTLAAHGYTAGQIFNVPVSTTVATVVLVGDYVVTAPVTANTFHITGSPAANATTSGSENAGNARLLYLIPPGLATSAIVTGYGSGGYGLGGYGVGVGASFLPLRYWFLDNFGATLIAAISNGAMYYWNSPASNRAVVVPNSPLYSTAMFIAMPAQQVVSLGAEVLGAQDPLLIRWSDAGDFTVWTASATNQAGSYRLSRGTRIVGGIQGPLAGLIWTDDDLWQMSYIQPPFIYGFTMIASGMGLIAPLARGIMGRNVYWMSQLGFYVYGWLSPQNLPCPVWDTVFQNIANGSVDKTICAVNSHTNEVAWFYASATGTGEIDSYVRLNTISNAWDYGPLTQIIGTQFLRTAWTDGNAGNVSGLSSGLPLGVGIDNFVYQHEIGYNADTGAMQNVHSRSGFMDISEGDQMMEVMELIPDFKMLGSSPQLQLSVIGVDEPTGTPIQVGPYTVNQSSTIISILPHLRTRQVAVQIDDSGNNNSWWRLGAVRYRAKASGKRPMSL